MSLGVETLEMWGRLDGEQNNSYAEAMALLQVLRAAPLGSNLWVYVDNTGVIENWMGREGYGGRLTQGARAIWNRIYMLAQAREEKGSSTELRWIHSHVEQEERRVRKGALGGALKWVCSCGGDERGDCVASHHHHIGNDWADTLAEKGKGLVEGTRETKRCFEGGVWRSGVLREAQLQAIAGEDNRVLYDNSGTLVQGCVKTALKGAAVQKRVNALGKGTSKRGRAWALMRELSWGGTPGALYKSMLSMRFVVRMLAGCLPTYENISQRIGDGNNIYGYVWGDKESLCRCPCCGEGVTESMDHVMRGCPAGDARRKAAIDELQILWDSAGASSLWDSGWWLSGGEGTPQGWEPWWGWVGVLPHSLHEGLLVQGVSLGDATALLANTARVLGCHAHDRWKQRNDMVQKAEELSGVAERKAEAGRARWSMPRCETGLRRGRPPKPVGELSAGYRCRKESKAHRDQVMLELGPEKGNERHRAWLAERRANHSEADSRWVQSSITAYTIPVARFSQGQGVEQGALRGHCSRVCQGRCVVEGCEEVGLRATVGCGKAAFRCTQHDGISCWGGWRGCDCMASARERCTKVGRKVKGTQRRVERRQQRDQETARLRDEVCDRVMAGEVLYIRARLKSLTCVGTVNEESIITSALLSSAAGQGQWRRVRELYVLERDEEVSVMLFDENCHWGIIEADDPEYPLESPAVSEDEECEEDVDEGYDSGNMRPHGGDGGVVGDGSGEVEDGRASTSAPEGTPHVMDLEGSPVVVLSECFNWEAAHLLLQVLPQRRDDMLMCCAASHATLTQIHLLEDWQVDALSLSKSMGEGMGRLREWGVSKGVENAAVQHRELVEKLRSVDSVLDSLPRYLACATRGDEGALARVRVRYDRKSLTGGQGVKVGRAYPSVVDPVTGEKALGALALTAMPRQVRNALICHPTPTLVDLDLVKCYPSILVALAMMWEIDPHRYQLLQGFVRSPKEHCVRVAEEMGGDVSGAKDAINRIISDPQMRHMRQRGWVSGFEAEVHELRRDIVGRHHLRDQFWEMPRTGGGAPNIGTVVHRVITDYEMRAIAVAVQVLSDRGVQVCTYEYDGVKVLSEHWLSHGEGGRSEMLREVSKVINERVFNGRARGVVTLAEKTMDYSLYESDMLGLSNSELGGSGTITVSPNPLYGCVQEGAVCDGGGEGPEGAEFDGGAAEALPPQTGATRGELAAGDAQPGGAPSSWPPGGEDPPVHPLGDTGEERGCQGSSRRGGGRLQLRCDRGEGVGAEELCSQGGAGGAVASESGQGGGYDDESEGEEGHGRGEAAAEGGEGCTGVGCGGRGRHSVGGGARQWREAVSVGGRGSPGGTPQGLGAVRASGGAQGGPQWEGCGGASQGPDPVGDRDGLGRIRGGGLQGHGGNSREARGARRGSAVSGEQGGPLWEGGHAPGDTGERLFRSLGGDGEVVFSAGKVPPGIAAGGVHLPQLHRGVPGLPHEWGAQRGGSTTVRAPGGLHRHDGGRGAVGAAASPPRLCGDRAAGSERPRPGGSDGGAGGLGAEEGQGGRVCLQRWRPAVAAQEGICAVDDDDGGRVCPQEDGGSLLLLQGAQGAPAGSTGGKGQRPTEGAVGGLHHRCGQESNACGAGRGDHGGDGAGVGPRLRPRGPDGRVQSEGMGSRVWVCIEPMALKGSKGEAGGGRKGRRRGKGSRVGKQGGHMGGGAALVEEILDDGGKRGDVHPQETGGVSGSHALGRVWVEPGWMSWRVGEMSRSVRSRLMAMGDMELEVVDSGVWQIDLAQPRAPAGVRPAYMSTEGIMRALEAKGIWGLSGLEVAYRMQGKVPILAPAGTVPDGAERDFWAHLQRAQMALRARVMETDVGRVWQYLEDARLVGQRSRLVMDENRVFDPGVT